MKKVVIKIKEDICNYMNLLDMNIESRKKLLMIAFTELGIDHPVTKAYEKEFFIYDAAMKESMRLIQSIIPEELQVPTTFWKLDYEAFVLTVTIADSVADRYVSNPEHPNLYDEKYWGSDDNLDIIDNIINEELNSLYNTDNFDFERGLLNE